MRKLALLVLAIGTLALPAGAQKAPDFTLPDGDGKPFALNSQKNKVEVISFWASYCKPCIAEMPFMENVWKTYRDSGLMVIGINIDNENSRAKAKDIVARQKLGYPALYDAGQKARELYGVRGLPSVYLVDKRGNIREHFEGFSDKTKTAMLEKIKVLLAELKAPPVVYFAGLECRGKASQLKGRADSLVLASIAEKCRIITFETGSPSEADYFLAGSMVQMGNLTGMDLALKRDPNDAQTIANAAATGQNGEALAKLKNLANEILSNVK